MARRSPGSGMAPDVRHALEQLEATLAALAAEVAAIRDGVAPELRARRLVITEDDGFARVVLEAAEHSGGVAVHGRGLGPASTCVELFANDPIDADGAHVGLAITDAGDVTATLELLQGQPPTLWIRPPEAGTPGSAGAIDG